MASFPALVRRRTAPLSSRFAFFAVWLGASSASATALSSFFAMLTGTVSSPQLAPFLAASRIHRTVAHVGALVVGGVEPTVVVVVVGAVPFVVLVVEADPIVVLVVVDEPGLQIAMPRRPSARSNWNATCPLPLRPRRLRPPAVAVAKR